MVNSSKKYKIQESSLEVTVVDDYDISYDSRDEFFLLRIVLWWPRVQEKIIFVISVSISHKRIGYLVLGTFICKPKKLLILKIFFWDHVRISLFLRIYHYLNSIFQFIFTIWKFIGNQKISAIQNRYLLQGNSTLIFFCILHAKENVVSFTYRSSKHL